MMQQIHQTTPFMVHRKKHKEDTVHVPETVSEDDEDAESEAAASTRANLRSLSKLRYHINFAQLATRVTAIHQIAPR